MQKSEALPEEDAQFIKANDITSRDVLDANISSYTKLREMYPRASSDLWEAMLRLRVGKFRSYFQSKLIY